MGQLTDAKIAAFQEETGIKPAIGERADRLRNISNLAVDLIKVIELERSGIRDGDGGWYGCSPFLETMDELSDACRELKELDHREWKERSADRHEQYVAAEALK
jgi:hypothetical protein